MRVIEDLSDFPADIQTVLTTGTFDGVHLGHKKILKQVVNLAKESNKQSVVLTYWPHPRFVLHQNDDSLKLLSTFDEKAQLLQEVGIDYLVRIPFTKEFSQMDREDFVKKVLVAHLNVSSMVIGYDHHFGKDRRGNFSYLQEQCGFFGFTVEEISRHDIDDLGVSSTKIREHLLAGRIQEARAFLGRNYGFKGLVVHGEKNGRSIGFPTANLWVPEGYKLIPGNGSYAVRVVWGDSRLEGMANIGVRPTLDGVKRRVEVNVFKFEERLYGEELEIQFVKKLRDERKFDNLADLKVQLEKDRNTTKRILIDENN